LGLLYSGNLGKAHEYELFLQLARLVLPLDPGIRFTFAGRGNRFEELQSELRQDDTNIRLAGFASEDELERRLAAADIHLLSLRADWDGIVVPSKFFGSLAVGRPVLYLGSRESDIGSWIREFDCGLILDPENVQDTAQELLQLAEDQQRLSTWQENAFKAYRDWFSKEKVMHGWDAWLHKHCL
jgi:glycosyltransferase involved in cell wall biosynthesis